MKGQCYRIIKYKSLPYFSILLVLWYSGLEGEGADICQGWGAHSQNLHRSLPFCCLRTLFHKTTWDLNSHPFSVT